MSLVSGDNYSNIVPRHITMWGGCWLVSTYRQMLIILFFSEICFRETCLCIILFNKVVSHHIKKLLMAPYGLINALEHECFKHLSESLVFAFCHIDTWNSQLMSLLVKHRPVGHDSGWHWCNWAIKSSNLCFSHWWKHLLVLLAKSFSLHWVFGELLACLGLCEHDSSKSWWFTNNKPQEYIF